MSAPKRGGGRRRRGGGGHGGHGGGDERWLITYADMLTLLLALFIVLYSISSVNTSKFEALQTSLRDAFSGKIVSGGEGIIETGVSATRDTPSSVIPNITPPTPQIADPRSRADREALAARREDQEFRRIKAQIEAYARAHGLEDQVEAVVARRGLIVRLLTDEVLFDSGFADLKPRGIPLLNHVGNLLKHRQDPPDPRRGPHRRRADQHLAVRLQLGAVDGPRDRGRPLPDRPRRADHGASAPPATPTQRRSPSARRSPTSPAARSPR